MREHLRQSVFRRPEFVDGEGFYFLGRHYRLKLVDPDQVKAPFQPFASKVTVCCSGESRQLLAKSELPSTIRAPRIHYLNDAVRRWKKVVGVEPARFVKVMDLGFRWGSCSADGTLNFHWRVMQLPPQVIDYVVVHELAHLKVNDHSPAFWQEVRRVLPNYQTHRNWLRQKGGDL